MEYADSDRAVCSATPITLDCTGDLVAGGSKRHSLQAFELSQRTLAAVQIVSDLPAPRNGGPIYRFLSMPAMRTAGWLALLITKAGDVETNPGPTTLNKHVWICDICHKQIHVRK